jgi:uncharacterized phage protein (TIGR02218 family)
MPIIIFDGNVVEVEPGSTEVRVTVRSALSKLSTEIPKRLIQPQCPYSLYDTNCGVAEAAWTHARTAASGTTASVVKLSSSSTNATVGGRLTVTSGTYSGQTRTIKAVSGVDVTLAIPLPGAPATGAGLSVAKGCDKTRAACRGFSNIARFGGFPDTPKASSGGTP